MSGRNSLRKPAAKDAWAAAEAAAAAVAHAAPSPIGLGRQLAAVSLAHDRFDHVNIAEGDNLGKEEMRLLEARAEALRQLLSTVPARSLEDAVVLVSEAGTIAARMGGDGSLDAEVVDKAEAIERMIWSALPFLAKAAGLDMKAMDWLDNAALAAQRYAGVQS